jgi:hypothetical protein
VKGISPVTTFKRSYREKTILGLKTFPSLSYSKIMTPKTSKSVRQNRYPLTAPILPSRSTPKPSPSKIQTPEPRVLRRSSALENGFEVKYRFPDHAQGDWLTILDFFGYYRSMASNIPDFVNNFNKIKFRMGLI